MNGRYSTCADVVGHRVDGAAEMHRFRVEALARVRVVDVGNDAIGHPLPGRKWAMVLSNSCSLRDVTTTLAPAGASEIAIA